MKKKVGQVSESERDVIKSLYERKNGLIELSKILTTDNDLYEKVVIDLGETCTRFQQWWNEMSLKYKWESTPLGKWIIDFETCEVFLE